MVLLPRPPSSPVKLTLSFQQSRQSSNILNLAACAIAVTGEKSLDALAGIKPIREQGVPGYKISSWYGILAPIGTPNTIILKINTELGRIIEMPDVKSKLLEQGWTTVHTSPAQMNQQIKTGIQEWKIVIQKANITLD